MLKATLGQKKFAPTFAPADEKFAPKFAPELLKFAPQFARLFDQYISPTYKKNSYRTKAANECWKIYQLENVYFMNSNDLYPHRYSPDNPNSQR